MLLFFPNATIFPLEKKNWYCKHWLPSVTRKAEKGIKRGQETWMADEPCFLFWTFLWGRIHLLLLMPEKILFQGSVQLFGRPHLVCTHVAGFLFKLKMSSWIWKVQPLWQHICKTTHFNISLWLKHLSLPTYSGFGLGSFPIFAPYATIA